MSIKDKQNDKQKKLIENSKKSDLHKVVLDYFPDAELIEVDQIQKKDE